MLIDTAGIRAPEQAQHFGRSLQRDAFRKKYRTSRYLRISG